MIDCFMFFNELDLLEIRLNSLAPYIEKFVLVESTYTHSGKQKPLYFDRNRDRFKDFNIVHLVMDKKLNGNNWDRENAQREFLMNGVSDVSSETTVLLSNLDEIPDLANYNGEWQGAFKQKLYYYALNIFTGISNWKGTIAMKRGNITSLQPLRDCRNKMPGMPNSCGWHFSTLGTPEQIKEKIESFAHQELNTPERKAKVAKNMEDLVDPYNRHERMFTIEMPSGPEWLLKNKERYNHLFYTN